MSANKTIEIERKFLVVGTGWQHLEGADKPFPILQGYLPTQAPCTLRIRTFGDEAWFTCKTNRVGLSREEYEHQMPIDHALVLLEQMCSRPLIRKTRYKVIHAGDLWEVDIFEGENQGLVIAEIELESEDQVFNVPEWVGEEVSMDHRYTNSMLSARPISTWK